ncbi:hypothetical protein H6800_02005 [Candidatus Nomurabacteria bacterium]|nr:hypothetical protein [Candidatus Nomurabacteria bacterium]
MLEDQYQVVKSKSNDKYLKIGIIIAVVVLVFGIGGFVTYKYISDQNAKIARLSDPQEAAKDEVTKLVALVGKITDLPTDESPTLATVQDANKLKSQAFFAKAENGDKVLIFTKAKKAYLYRPSTNKIIEIAPINIGDNESTPSVTESN